MIIFDKTEVMGFEQAIRGMRNPMNSWDKSDSGHCGTSMCDVCQEKNKCKVYHYYACGYGKGFEEPVLDGKYIIGPNDHKLMMKLVKGGPVHAKFRRMIAVYVDITAPLYWWKEFDTYKVGTVANSCSTMHKIHERAFTLDDFSYEHLKGTDDQRFYKCFESTIGHLNLARRFFLETNDKIYWWQMIQLLPSSYNQKRTVMLNYEVLAGIYSTRKNHKLDEWVTFCELIEKLPYSDIITGTALKNDEKHINVDITGENLKKYNLHSGVINAGELKNHEITGNIMVAGTHSAAVGWIPVKVKLPEEAQEVLVTVEMDDSYGAGCKINHEIDIARFYKTGGHINGACGYGTFDTINDWDEGQPIRITAWAPKPDVYLESNEVV